MFFEVSVLEEGVHVETRGAEMVGPGHIRDDAFSVATHFGRPHPHVPVPHLPTPTIENEKNVYFQTHRSFYIIFSKQVLNRYQRFIHSVGGFKKPIYRYTNQAKFENINIQYFLEWKLANDLPKKLQ